MGVLNSVFGSGDSGSESKFDKVSFDDNLLVLPDRIIQISNISRMSSYCIKKTWKFRIIMFLITAAFVASAMGASEPMPMYIGSVFFGGLFLYAMLFKKFGIQIQTNGCTTDHLLTKNQDVADKLYSMIAYYIHHREGNSAITIDQSLNIIDSDIILGDQFKDIKGSTITNRSDNVEN